MGRPLVFCTISEHVSPTRRVFETDLIDGVTLNGRFGSFEIQVLLIEVDGSGTDEPVPPAIEINGIRQRAGIFDGL
jgi:hypothetical protein